MQVLAVSPLRIVYRQGMDPKEPLIDIHAARELLRQAVSSWEELLENLEAPGGRSKFRSEFRACQSPN